MGSRSQIANQLVTLTLSGAFTFQWYFAALS